MIGRYFVARFIDRGRTVRWRRTGDNAISNLTYPDPSGNSRLTLMKIRAARPTACFALSAQPLKARQVKDRTWYLRPPCNAAQ